MAGNFKQLAAVSVGAGAAVSISAGATPPCLLTVQNLGPAEIYIGDSTVTIATGVKILSGGHRTNYFGGNDEIFAITPAGTADVRRTIDLQDPEV